MHEPWLCQSSSGKINSPFASASAWAMFVSNAKQITAIENCGGIITDIRFLSCGQMLNENAPQVEHNTRLRQASPLVDRRTSRLD